MFAPPPPDFIHLILSSHENPFYLEIPIVIVATACSHPLKYLRYLAWCVLGVDGVLKDGQGIEIALHGEVLDQGVYYYIVPDDLDDALPHAVDLEVIKRQSGVGTSTQPRENLRAKLLRRDAWCVWTGMRGVGMHIIPHARGDEWLQCIIDNRPHEDGLQSFHIDDIENGILADSTLHSLLFDPRNVAVLKTSNPILETTDIPARCQRSTIRTDVSYPTDSRYTLQWIASADTLDLERYPNNNDATFRDHQLPKPADVLLHYNYGAAAVQQWGKNVGVLVDRPGIPRPSQPAQGPKGPKRDIHDREIAFGKRAAAMGQVAQGSGTATKGAAADSEAQDKWDADDVILFFWGNSKAAIERRARKEQVRTAYLEDWRTADYAQLLLRYASLKFKENPIAMTFLSIFAGLSALPLLSFAGLSIFTLSSIVFLALVSAAIVFITIEVILVACLVLTLWSLLVVASFSTVLVVSTYWTTRLGMFVSREGPSGVSDWAHETRQYLYAKKREPTEESDESAVLVDRDGPSSKKVKVEEEITLSN